jgi:leader peptidase (prepilin peptidase) / N-methyltransferase
MAIDPAAERATPRSDLCYTRSPWIVGFGRIAAAAGLGAGSVLLGPAGRVVVPTIAVGILLYLSVVDVRHRILPNRIVLPTSSFVLAGHIATRPERSEEWLLAAAGTFVVLLALSLPSRGGLGMGDVKTGLLVGATVGSGAALALMVAFLTAPIYALALVIRHGSGARAMAFPFGPFLAFGTAAALAADVGLVV